jgi:hypothetical protein
MKAFIHPEMFQDSKQYCFQLFGHALTSGMAALLVLASVTTGLIILLNERVINEVNKNKQTRRINYE